MPSVSGTSVLNGQRVIGYGAITVPQFEILIPAERNGPPFRIGYGWVRVRDNASPNNIRVIQRGPIYQPGVFYTFANQYGFTNVQYDWWIEWNEAGIGWIASFS